MADSLLGAASQSLSPDSIALLDASSAIQGMTSATIQSFGGTTLVRESDTHNGSAAILLPGSAPVSATVVDGTLSVAVQLPAGVGVGFTGTAAAVAPAAVGTYLHGLIEAALPDASTAPSVVAYRASLTTAVNKIVDSMAAAGVTNAMVRVVQVSDTSTGTTPTSITLDAGGSASKEVFALLMGGVHSGTTVNLAGAENTIVVGSGTVKVTGNAAAQVRGDVASQNITGGAGNDTLVGGGGNDTLVGGQGSDTFGVGSAPEALTISDLSFTDGDKINFEVPGVTSIAQLATLVTGVTTQGGNTTYSFQNGTTITLIGVSASEVGAHLADITFVSH